MFYMLQHHWLNGKVKSLDDRDALQGYLSRPDFRLEDVRGVNLRDIDHQLADAAKAWDPKCPPLEGWRNIGLRLLVPPLCSSPSTAGYVDVPGFRVQKLTDVMVKVFSMNNISTIHYEPFESCWQPPGTSGPLQQVLDEIYASPKMLEAHREVHHLTIADSNCKLPRCVAAFMFSSDGVQFGSFSHAKGWPILCYFAHVPTLLDQVQETITLLHAGKPPTDALLTHLRWELMHEIWKSLLDNEFVDVWKNGMVVKCADGITRRVFPRIMTYSADYPEKVLIATIRNGGKCLCLR
ncbi:hypothetical protein BDV93DRAFT_562963 [Ceratobasidium sp. AG-I]|nr:hypothetical protein BDV93DRAFT_562963 [Ceratobasidium sp. AG-I]